MRLIAGILGLLLVCMQPAAAAQTQWLQPLERHLAMISARNPGNIGIAAMDLQTGEVVSTNGDEPFPMASTVKIAIAANYLAQVEHGRRSLDDRIGGQSANRLIEAMIVRSDNHATDLLLRDLGGPATVQRWLTQSGVEGLRIDRSIAQLLRARRDLHDIRDSSTPVAMVELLRMIDSGEMLAPWSKAYLLRLMGRCITGRNRIRGMLPLGTPVQNKTGTLAGYSSDVGYITLPNGRRIAVAVFARAGGNRAQIIARAARTVYDGFAYATRMAVSPATIAKPAINVTGSGRTAW